MVPCVQNNVTVAYTQLGVLVTETTHKSCPHPLHLAWVFLFQTLFANIAYPGMCLAKNPCDVHTELLSLLARQKVRLHVELKIVRKCKGI